ncbi:hypothetical protein G9A89_014247 [Geosiphon pyriformis]|nr:hypothetical protein G9A89_014247 [Geosiphon pyriformis]
MPSVNVADYMPGGSAAAQGPGGGLLGPKNDKKPQFGNRPASSGFSNTSGASSSTPNTGTPQNGIPGAVWQPAGQSQISTNRPTSTSILKVGNITQTISPTAIAQNSGCYKIKVVKMQIFGLVLGSIYDNAIAQFDGLTK